MNITIGKKQYYGRLNRDNRVEIVGDSGNKAIVDEENSQLVIEGGKNIPLNRVTMTEVAKYKKGIRKELVEYYNELLAGKEKIELIPTNDTEDYTYIITSQRLLNHGHKTEKYAEVLASAFYPKSLAKVGLDTGEFFEDMHDVHQRVGRLRFSDSHKVIDITLKELVQAVFEG